MLTRKTPMKRSSLRRDTGEARLEVPVLRLRKCKAPGCVEKFRPARPFQTWCSPECGYFIGMQIRLKQDKAKDRETRERLMKLSEWRAKAQTIFNRFIRTRDEGKPCICCGQPFEPSKPGGSADAGHFRSRGSAPHMAFVEDNTFSQRKNCNRPGGTTHDKFKAGVIARIGLERTEAVLADQTVRKYTATDYKEMIDHYRASIRALRKEQTCR